MPTTLSKEEAQAKLNEIRREIRRHDYLYYVKNQPEISDEAYDNLMRGLLELEQAYPEFVAPDSPSQRIGEQPAEEFAKIEHVSRMMSLESVNEEQKLRDFDRRVRKTVGDRVTFVAEPKFDGLSVELVYIDGVLHHASTRGDGTIGEEITQNIRTIRAVPLALDMKKRIPLLAVRGEVLMPITEFERLNESLLALGKDGFANPRNAAAGSVRQLDPSITSHRRLDIYCYDLLRADGIAFEKHIDVMNFLISVGLKVNPLYRQCDRVEQIIEFHRQMFEQRDSLDYEIDGIVVKVNELAHRDTLGSTSRNPRWALAYKFEARHQETEVMNIGIHLGRTGSLNPVALLRPVQVGGVTVSRATLHNMNILRKLDVRIGDKVKVKRAGDVIPEIAEVNKSARAGREREFHMPDKCPACGSDVAQQGTFYVCTGGLSCPAQVKQHIEHYASRGAMDIAMIGERTAEQLVELGLVSNPSDLYHLTMQDVMQLEGFAEKSAHKLIDAIQQSKNPRFDRFLYALSIPLVGEHMAYVLATHFNSLEELQQADESRLESIPAVGPEIAKSIATFFRQPRNQQVVKKLLDAGVRIRPIQPAAKLLEGKKFVFTGALSKLTREEAQSKVEELGGRATSSVSKDTDYVVVGEKPGSKYEAARRLGVTIITEEDFLEMCGTKG